MNLTKMLFSSSSLSAIRVISSAYLRLLIFLPATLIPACDSSSLVFQMMNSACMLNKQGDNIVLMCSFPNLDQSIVPNLVLTVASCPAYRLLRRQVRWSDIPISLRIFQVVVIYTVKGFSIVNEARVDIFSGIPLLSLDNLISGSSAFSKSSLNIWKFLVHILLKPSLKDFEHYLASV